MLTEAGEVVLERLTALMDEPASARDNQTRRDCWMAYKKCRPLWLDSTMKVWRECLAPPVAKKTATNAGTSETTAKAAPKKAAAKKPAAKKASAKKA